ncbi:MAG: Histidine kinase, partial [Verrucomicrobiaceae bacterium]|nr:Histidine kinase [Verrucomicrobiaceae bacterium]
SLREAKEAAESANRAKDRFLAVLSHELRTPLTPVLMVASALEGNPDLPAFIKEDMAMIRRNVDLETKLIDDLLDISRIASGKLALRLESVEINHVVSEACAICSAQLQQKGVRLEVHLVPGAGRVSADPARLQQVLWNLLNNAIKFTPAQGCIRVTSRRVPDGRVQVEVMDSGMGIATEMLPQIFDAFEQGDRSITGKFGGLGLGLAISQALVELHNGSLTAASKGLGRGATFTVELPLESLTASPPQVSPPTEAAVDLARLRLLVVEDHADTGRVLSSLLRRSGFEVTLTGTVAEGVRLAQTACFDVVVSDLGLPDGTGHDLMSQIRQTAPIPGIAMSGYGMEEDLRKSAEAGFSDHLVKPISVPKLEQAIRRVAAERHAPRV